MQAYTYSIRHIPSNTIYYGVRKSSIEDLGISYFSSSKLLKRMISEETTNNFEYKIRRKFESYEEARLHETKLLQRINAISNPRVLNQAISSPRICAKDSVSEEIRRIKISVAMTSVWKRKSYREKKTQSTEYYSNIGKMGANKRAENYASGKTKRKPKSKPNYKDVLICKNDVMKTVKSNQVPAYLKSGWIKVPVTQEHYQ